MSYRKITRYFLTLILISFSANAEIDIHNPGYSSLVENLIPAIVNVSTTQKIQQTIGEELLFTPNSGNEEFNELFERFFGMTRQGTKEKERHSLGSGFVIDPKGYIVTNHHVIMNADEITVNFNNDKKFPAKIVGFDSKTDLALLKIEPDASLPYLNFGDSDKSKVGDIVLAIGNPFGLGGTVTSGIISARSRDINAGLFDNFIQTDAAINSGNSGGPMFNLAGEIIGINTAIYSTSGGSIGIGFAIPANMAKPIINQLKEKGKVSRGWLGIKIEPVTIEISESLGLKEPKGAIVVDVEPKSPAAKSGIIVGDVIIEFDGQEINNNKALPRVVMQSNIGQKSNIVIIRDGNRKTLKITLEELKEEMPQQEPLLRKNNLYSSKLGMRIEALNESSRSRFGLDTSITGLAITGITKSSEAYKKGLLVNDVLLTANNKQLHSLDSFEKIINQAIIEKRKYVVFLVIRNKQAGYITLSLSDFVTKK
jgi:serine protease Do